MFGKTSLALDYYFLRSALIFEAEERRPAGPFPGRRNVV